MHRLYYLTPSIPKGNTHDKAYWAIKNTWGTEPIYRSDLNGLLRRMLGVSATTASETIDDLVKRGLLEEIDVD